MLSGRLRVRVEIWRNVQVGVTDLNSPIMQPQLWRSTAAEMRARRGNEHHSGEQVFALTQWFFVFRYHSIAGIDPTMWLVVNGQKYDIRNIVPDFARKRSIEVEARVANINMADGSSGGLFALAIRLTSNIPPATVGEAYSTTAPEVTGGTPQYTFSAAGELPSGLAVNAATGSISGTPSASGSFPVRLQVRDASGNTAYADLVIEVDGAGSGWVDSDTWNDADSWSDAA